MGRLSITELLILLGIAMLLFGASRISDIGKGLGEGIRHFKKGLKDEEQQPPKQLPEKGEERGEKSSGS
jgi:sec-independent protein translocase protein TatA